MVWITAVAAVALSFLKATSASVITERENVPNSPCLTDFISILALDAVKPVPNSNVPWKNGNINANNNRFYIGNESLVLCPNQMICDTTPSKAQVVLHHQEKILRLNVNVLGGQQIYIDDKGALRYNQVKEPLPKVKTNNKVWALQDYRLNPKIKTLYNNDVNIWWACPVSSAKKNTGPWQIFADTRQVVVKDKDVPSKYKKDCTIFGLHTQFLTPLFYNNVGW